MRPSSLERISIILLATWAGQGLGFLLSRKGITFRARWESWLVRQALLAEGDYYEICCMLAEGTDGTGFKASGWVGPLHKSLMYCMKAYSLITQYPFFPGTGQPKKDNYVLLTGDGVWSGWLSLSTLVFVFSWVLCSGGTELGHSGLACAYF